MTTARQCVAVCGFADDGSSDLDALTQAVRALGHWEVVTLRWPDVEALRRVRAQAVGYVMLARTGENALTLQTALALRDDGVPLIVVGSDPCSLARPDCWVRDLSSPNLLRTLLAELPRENKDNDEDEPAPLSWRRKTDVIVGNSRQMIQLRHSLERIAASAASVLVTGESGSGKELVARALHFGGPRAHAPFVAINCAAIPPTLFEAELFGYQRGAFTGAVSSRAGAFESATEGTLFLDEIGELPLALQPKLLRVLETGEVTRLGANEPRKINTRVVCATNRDLDDEVSKGLFREDLLYRLRVFSVRLPPLRERPEDIPALVQHHLALIATRERRPVPKLTPDALEKLVRHSWQGNVRELINTLERAFVVGNPIDADHIALSSPTRNGDGGTTNVRVSTISSYRNAKTAFETQYYDQLMRVSNGNVTFASKLAKKSRKEIYDALKRLNLIAESYRDPSSLMSEEPPTRARA